MSLMKMFASDMAELTTRAADAAWEETRDLRAGAFAAVIEDCEKSSKVYHDPSKVYQAFMRESIRAYMRARTAKTYSHAG